MATTVTGQGDQLGNRTSTNLQQDIE